MIKIIHWLLVKLRSKTLNLLILTGLILLAWGTISPVGTLVWWLKQTSENFGVKDNRGRKLASNQNSNSASPSLIIDCYIIFLPGVGDFSANQLTLGEEIFLKKLRQLHQNCVVVSDVFPYSAANESLGGRRFLAPLWRFAEEADGWLSMADVLIKIRNLWRLAISVDPRYGKIYNQGLADAIINRMNDAHPIPDQSEQTLKIILIGTSGGAQVALGAAPYLKEWLNPKITVVSVGGVFAGTDGFNAAKNVYHLKGSQDWIENIGTIVFPSRWPWTVGSPFNQAVQQGSFTALTIGSQAHDGETGYFGTNPAKSKDVTYVELTLDAVNQLPIWSAD